MANFENHQKSEFETIKNVHIFVKNGVLFLEKTKVTYTIHKDHVTHNDPVVTYEEVPLCGYGYTCWDFVPGAESQPGKPNFYKK